MVYIYIYIYTFIYIYTIYLYILYTYISLIVHSLLNEQDQALENGRELRFLEHFAESRARLH